MFTCILLSAGLSERFGSPKALANIAGFPIIHQIQETLLKTCCDEIIIVLGAHANLIHPSIFIHSRIRVVHNNQYNFGQTSSIQAGLREANQSSKGVLFLPVDCPLIKTSTINTIIDDFKKLEPDILIPTYKNKKGHPPIFHQRLYSEILYLPLTLGLNSLFSKHPPVSTEIDDPGIIKSFNTPQELEDIKKPC